MRAIELQTTGPELFKLVERPKPRPRRGDIVVRVHAASINYRDHQVASGSYHMPLRLPLIPLSDGAGEVVEVGEDVTRFRPGERVASCFWQRWDAGGCEHCDPLSTLGGPLDGMLAEYVVLDERGAVKVPSHLSDEEAASLPCAAVTAWRGLVTEGHIQAGDQVLIQGTGGVSLFALQIANMVGARAIVVSRSAAKLERAKALGAAVGIDLKRTSDWVADVLEETGGRGVDHIVDVSGPPDFAQTMRALRIGGQINIVGYVGGMRGEINPLMLLERQATLRGLQVGPRSSFEALTRALTATGTRPVIDSVHPWTEVGAALNHLRRGEHFGKIALRF
ncbi:MAG: NAD(P)-dependent alcohol dehydrogenase [Polyangiales bacterium]